MTQLRTEPVKVKQNQEVNIHYKGPLATVDELYLYYGFDGWIQPQSLLMQKKPDQSFEISLTAKGERMLDFCFHTKDNLWDNNGGSDWHLDII